MQPFVIKKRRKWDFDAPASTWMSSPSRRPAMTLTFDLSPPKSNQPSVGIMNIPLKFHRDCSSRPWDIVVTICVRTNRRTNERTNEADGQPKNIMSSPTLSGSAGKKRKMSPFERHATAYNFDFWINQSRHQLAAPPLLCSCHPRHKLIQNFTLVSLTVSSN